MTFWSAATAQAGREFGARYWRWFAAVRVLRRVAGPAMFAILIAGLALAGYIGYRLFAPDWSSIGSSVADFAPAAGRWILFALIVAAVAAGIGWGMIALWRAHSWRWSRSRF